MFPSHDHGGVIVPRGVSIVGQDLRKCKIRPKYVPDPENADIERSAIFRITGATYFQSFTVFDADQNSTAYKDYTVNDFTPTFSHRKLTAFEYVDGANDVDIDDDFLTYSTAKTDLDMYYEKIGIVYGPTSGREIQPDYPSDSVDIESKVDEFRIVGPTSGQIGITSIKSGDGITPSTFITVDTDGGIDGLNVDTRIEINGIAETEYNGYYIVTEVVSVDSDGNPTSFKYRLPTVPDASIALPSPTGGTVTLASDTVSLDSHKWTSH